jgi:hypothetical protein
MKEIQTTKANISWTHKTNYAMQKWKVAHLQHCATQKHHILNKIQFIMSLKTKHVSSCVIFMWSNSIVCFH